MPDLMMDPEVMTTAESNFGKGAELFSDAHNAIQSLVGALRQGALLGVAGDALAESLETKLLPNLEHGHEVLQTLSTEIRTAREDLLGSDQTAAGRFSGAA